MWRTVPFLNACIAVVMFVVALVVICYMLAMFTIGLFDIGSQIMGAAFLPTDERQTLFTLLNVDFAYNLAYLFVLMKAYAVIVHYLRHYEVDLKQVVELGIIVAILELIFNASAYAEHTQTVLMWLATASFAVYALRYHLRSAIERLAAVPATDGVPSVDVDQASHGDDADLVTNALADVNTPRRRPAARRMAPPKKKEPLARSRRLAKEEKK